MTEVSEASAADSIFLMQIGVLWSKYVFPMNEHGATKNHTEHAATLGRTLIASHEAHTADTRSQK